MELRHLRYFIVLAEELNFTRAAARLGIGQPPLSRQIRDLETELGVALLRRVPHGAELTEAGKTFLDESRRALAATDHATLAAKRAARGELGRLRLGFTSSAHFSAHVPTAIRNFARAYPEVELQLEEANTFKLLDGLTQGQLDVAFTHSGLEDRTKLDLLPIHDEPLVVLLPASHGCADQARIDLGALAEDRFILKPPRIGPELFKAVVGACRAAGFEPRMGQEAPQLATVVSLVAAGLGVSLVPISIQQIQAPGVVFRPLAGASAHVTLSLAWRRHERASVVRNFVTLAKRST